MTVGKVVHQLRAAANQRNVAGMARFGINPKNTLGVSLPVLRALAKKIGKNQKLSLELWRTKIHEARILAALVGEFRLVGSRQMDSWAKDFDSWDVCDQVCSNLFDKTTFAWAKAIDWSQRREEFVKRAGFVLMAVLAVHDKKTPDKNFLVFLPYIKKESIDERNFVKKAVNWALRQIGKRSPFLRIRALGLCQEIIKINSRSARWIANDAKRELLDRRFKITRI